MHFSALGSFPVPVCPSADRWAAVFLRQQGLDGTLEDAQGTGGAAAVQLARDAQGV